MLLQRLVEYAERDAANAPPTLYTLTPIASIIDLYTRAPDTASLTPTISKEEKRGVRRLAPQVTRAMGIKPLLLADNAEYTLGLARDPAKAARVAACHAAYIDILTRCAAATGEPEVVAVRDFLAHSLEALAAMLALPDDFDRGGLITFRVDGVFPIDLPKVRAFWANEHDPAAKEGGGRLMQCLICGQARPVLDRLQGKVKGVLGGQTSGTSIISANAEAFESYGLKASLIAPTCADCGEKFTKALNSLIADKGHRLYLGDATFVFWTREDVGFSFLDFVNNPTEETVKRLFSSPLTGKETTTVNDTAFYALSLSGSGGRAVVRDWIDTTVGAVKGNLAKWFAWQRMTGGRDELFAPLSVFSLATATVRESKDLTPQTARTLLHTALTGQPLPWDMLAQVVRRTRVEQRVTRPQAALIKLVLSSLGRIEATTMDELNPKHESAAYQCGRLLAVLENLQEAAIPGIKAGVGDRYFGTASSAPALVFPRLLPLAKSHLTKIERDKPGVYYRIQEQLDAVVTKIGAFPRTLTLEDQGLFGLGYFHEGAANRAAAKEGSERKKARLAGQAGQVNDASEDDAAN